MREESVLQTDAQEVITHQQEGLTCETYLFEPEVTERNLGWLMVAGCIDDREGVGGELLDVVVTAIQKEYHRDPKRPAGRSFELALHQANLILHDMSEQGMRTWMKNFNVVVASLAGNQLHLSVAGDAQALLIRKATATDISIGLSQVPIADPLQTFSQVATGIIAPQDTLFLSALPLQPTISNDELKHIALEHSAQLIGDRLQQRYESSAAEVPLSAVVVHTLPGYVARSQGDDSPPPSRAVNQQNLQPRRPLVIQKSAAKRIFRVIRQSFVLAGNFVKAKVWPLVKIGSKRGGKAIVQASRSTGENIQSMAREGKLKPPTVGSLKKSGTQVFQKAVISTFSLRQFYERLPKSSKIFAVLSIILLVLLASSLLLLRQKRASDAEIKQASEALQEARTKTEAAKTALIYDNRDQARGLLEEAEGITAGLIAGDLYVDEAAGLSREIAAQHDRLQRIVRSDSASTETIGDFESVLESQPSRIFFVDDSVFTFNPDTNAVFSMTLEGEVSAATDTTQGIGFIADGTVHNPDKTIVLTTDQPGIALFDTKDSSLQSQEIDFPSSKPAIVDVNVFGNRLYVADTAAGNIFTYNKTLRGYSAGSPWIESQDFPVSTIQSLAIDGNIYTLHSDGTIRKLFKGAPTDFSQETVSPTISNGSYLLTSDEYTNLYVIDPANKRIVIYDKNGILLRQVIVDVAQEFADATVSPAEDKAYILDGTRVLAVSLVE